MMRGRLKKIVISIAKHTIMVMLSIFMVFPLLWGVYTSFKPKNQIFSYPPRFFSGYTIDNYLSAFQKQRLGMDILTTLGLTVVTIIFGISFAVFAAYVFSRYNFRGKKFFVSFIVAPMLIPGLVNLIPLFSVYARLNLLDNFWGLVLLYLPSVMPFSIMVLLNYLRSIPFDLEEAAMIDGCSRFQLLIKIVFPIMLPGVLAVSMIGFVGVWNEFIVTLIFTGGKKLRTLTVCLFNLVSSTRVNTYGLVCAVAFISLVPVLVIFIAFRKQFVNSIIDGAIKG